MFVGLSGNNGTSLDDGVKVYNVLIAVAFIPGVPSAPNLDHNDGSLNAPHIFGLPLPGERYLR